MIKPEMQLRELLYFWIEFKLTTWNARNDGRIKMRLGTISSSHALDLEDRLSTTNRKSRGNQAPIEAYRRESEMARRSGVMVSLQDPRWATEDVHLSRTQVEE